MISSFHSPGDQQWESWDSIGRIDPAAVGRIMAAAFRRPTSPHQVTTGDAKLREGLVTSRNLS
jgi:hypothetical protein